MCASKDGLDGIRCARGWRDRTRQGRRKSKGARRWEGREVEYRRYSRVHQRARGTLTGLASGPQQVARRRGGVARGNRAEAIEKSQSSRRAAMGKGVYPTWVTL